MRSVMKIREFAAVSLVLLSSFAAPTLGAKKSTLEAMYDKAFNAFDEARVTMTP